MGSIVKSVTAAFAVAALVSPLAVAAQPSGGTVVSGGATISNPSATSTLITQSTNSTIINWQSFSLSSGSSVVFDQPNAAAIALNRVLGGGVSQIDGSLQANGQVWIINANGILFGKGSQINVAGLLATTSDIADSDFAAGQYNFGIASTNPAATVENAGSINVGAGGAAILSGQHVANSGLIQANGGQIVLGGASAFTVDFDGDNLLRYAITTPVGVTPTDANGVAQKELVSNSGTLSAAGGRILLTARAAANVADNVVNNSGMISATSAQVVNGEVILDAGSGSVVDSGTIDATGNGAGQSGGTVALAGNSVTVADGAVIDASGDVGGGTVSIGGGLHGSGTLPPASTTSVGAATIRADANTNGNGGTIALWSTNTTTVNANLSAKGGAQGGDGGTIETSGATLQVGGGTSVDTSATQGKTGTWLLDPLFLIVADDGTQSLPTGNLGVTTDPGQTDTVSPATILAALVNTNVNLQALDDITVDSAIWGSAGGHTLRMSAGRSIFLNADINLTGNNDSLTLSADNSSFGRTDPGPGVISGTGVLTASKILLSSDSDGSDGGSIGTAAQPISIGGGKVTINTKGASAFIQSLVPGVNLLIGAVSVGAGDFTALSAGNLTIAPGAIISSSGDGDAVVLSASQNFVNNSGSGAISLTGGGRFLIYSAAPGGDKFGGLNSNNTAVWNATYPTAVSQAGNRYVFANQPTLTITSTNAAKTYGTDGSAAVAAAYTVSGFDPGVANAYLADNAASTFTGTPSVTSAGSATGASVAGGPYQITVAAGSLTTTSGYALQFTSTGRLTVNPAALLITANDQSMTYGGAMPTLTVNYSGFVNGDTAASLTTAPTVVSGTAANANAGTYVGTLTASGAVDSNYTISYAPGTLTINKAALLITASDQSMTYGGAMPTLTASYSGFVNGDTAASLTTAPTVVSGTAANANAGTYVGTLTASGAVDSNYTISYAPGTLTINKALLSVTADPLAKVYGTADPALTYAFDGLVNGDKSAVFVGALTRAPGQNVGNYAISQGTLSAGGNYTIAFTGANFSITPALLSVTANTQTKVYGSADPKLTYTFSGLVNGDTSAVFVGALARAQGQNVGNYAITQGTLSAGNYTIAFTGANFSITPATLTYVASSVNRTYGSASPALGGNITGFVNGDTLATATTGTLTFTTSATSSSNVGSYAVTGSGLSADNGNYVFVQAAGNATALTINPATLTYVATAGTIDQGSPIPLLTGMVTGFVNGDTLQSATTGTLVFTTTATSSSPPGLYAIIGSGLSANHGNYVFVQAPGNATALTINNVGVQNVGLGGYYPWVSGGDRPTDSPPSLNNGGNNGSGQYYVVDDKGGNGNDLPTPDTTTLSGPIAELTAAQGYIDPPTNSDRRSSSLSHYFGNGSLFDNNFPSWGNDLLWP